VGEVARSRPIIAVEAVEEGPEAVVEGVDRMAEIAHHSFLVEILLLDPVNLVIGASTSMVMDLLVLMKAQSAQKRKAQKRKASPDPTVSDAPPKPLSHLTIAQALCAIWMPGSLLRVGLSTVTSLPTLTRKNRWRSLWEPCEPKPLS